jgi:uncharacterized membrane protein YcjF (UPF0283 family)
MRLDLKSLAILVLLAFSISFFAMWYLKEDEEAKARIEILEEKNRKIRIKYESSVSERNILVAEYQNLVKEYESLDNRYQEIKKERDAISKRNDELLKVLDKQRKDLINSIRRYEELRDNPPNKSEEELMKSLRKNFK